MSKPTNKPGWNPTSNSTEPSSTKKAAGWSSGEKPSSAHFNWLFKTISEWIDHIDAEGVQGPKGDTGPQGSQGLKGDTGAIGPQGLQGDKGDTGPQGAQGIQGAKGDTGTQGTQGLKGDTGATGSQGLQGLKGDTGATGAQGVQGLKGDTGATGAQGIQGAKGDTGPQGIQGLKGDTGATGPQGLQGAKGDTGTQGIQGLKGDTGATGPQGLKGDTGPQGATGASGSISSADLASIAALEAVSGVVAASPVTVTFPYNGGAAPSEYSIGDSGSSIAVNWVNGASQFVTLTADATISFSGAVAGNTYYLRIQQGGYGLKRVTGWPTNIVWNGGSVPTISSAAWTVDVIGCYYDGTNYYGYVSQGYFTAPSGIDTKNGYIAGGMSNNASLTTVEKINFNSDTTLSTVQTAFGSVLNSGGTYVAPSYSSYATLGQGTQSSLHGYRTVASYGNVLPSVNSNTTTVTTKLAFANDTGALVDVRTSNVAGSNSWMTTYLRRAVVQSSSSAYMSGGSTVLSKLLFSTDVTSNITTPTNFATPYTYSIGSSTSSAGMFWAGASSLGATLGFKMTFASETSALTTASYTNSVSDTGGQGEAIDSVYNAYYEKNTTATVTTAYKIDKIVDTWNTLATTLTTAGQGCAATQGIAAGYFCGGYSSISGTLPISVGASSIKKIQYAPEAFSIHTASLTAGRQVACGFEG
jgi:hypothetical protein